jgi:coniferyl-aldehyde dehydrogenase
MGKTFLAGQFCVAPDHVYVPERRVDEFVDAMLTDAQNRFPIGIGDDATAIVNEHHYARLQLLLDDARGNGAEVLELAQVRCSPRSRVIAPTLILNVSDAMAVCQEEIFGPLLPVRPYRSIDEVIARINAGPSPLAAYYFGSATADRDRFLLRTTSGGVTCNDIILHVGMEAMAFGGVGASGMGVYHGRAGFETFSHAKGVVEVSRSFISRMRHPYPDAVERAMRWHAAHSAAAARKRIA